MEQTPPSFDQVKIIKCSIHPYQPLDLIDLTGQSQNGRICQVCIQSNKIPFEQYLSMYQLFALPEEILSSYPPFKDQVIREQIQMYCNESTSKSNIDAFFQQLRNDVEAAIQDVENKVKKHLIKYQNDQRILIQELKKIAETNKLKELIISGSQNICKFLFEKWQNAELNDQAIQKCIASMKENSSIFDLERKQREANSLIQAFNKFSLFDQSENISKNNHNKQKSNAQNDNKQKNHIPNANNQLDANNNKDNIIKNVNLLKSTFRSSPKMTINKTPSHSLQLINKSCDDTLGQAHLDFNLNPKKRYTIKLNYHLQSSNQFTFGIVQDYNKDSQWNFNCKMSFSSNGNKCGIHNHIKGSKILKNINKQFEVRIFLEEKILKVALLPDYEQVLQLDDPNKISSITYYRFFVQVSSIGDMIEITDIIESDTFENNIF